MHARHPRSSARRASSFHSPGQNRVRFANYRVALGCGTIPMRLPRSTAALPPWIAGNVGGKPRTQGDVLTRKTRVHLPWARQMNDPSGRKKLAWSGRTRARSTRYQSTHTKPRRTYYFRHGRRRRPCPLCGIVVSCPHRLVAIAPTVVVCTLPALDMLPTTLIWLQSSYGFFRINL
jgi:hypothetical protein